MKKFLSFALCILMTMSLFTITSCAAAHDGRHLDFIDQDHIYLGSKPTEVLPNADGAISQGEYTTSIEFEPTNNESKSITDAKHWFAYDNENIYLAVEMNEPNFKANSNYFMFNIGFPTSGGFSDMFTRLRLALQILSDGKISVSSCDYLEFSTGSPTSYDIDPAKLLNGYAASHKNGKSVYELYISIEALKTEVGLNVTNLITFSSVNVTAEGQHWYYCPLNETNIESIAQKYPAHALPQDTWTMHVLHLADKPTDDSIGLTTMDGAKITMTSAESASMLFQMEFDRKYQNTLIRKYGENGYNLGMVIAPLEYVLEAGEFTAEALDKLSHEDAYKDYKVGSINKEIYARGTGTYIYAKHITGITDFKREYAAIAYVEADGVRTYAETYTRRSVAGVAFAALRDLSSAGERTDYKNALTVAGKALHSPYTADEISVLNTLVKVYSTQTLPKMPDPIQSKTAGDIRVVSSNVYFHIFKSLPDETAKQNWSQGHANTLAETDADVLLLQEMSGEIIKGKDFKWHERLNPILKNMGYTLVDCKLDTLFAESVSVGNPANVNYTPIFYRADKVTLIDSGHHFYESVATNPDSYLSSSKSYTWALFEDNVTKERFITFSTHLTYHGNAATANMLRIQDATELIAEIDNLKVKYPSVPFIVMGDLNCTSSSDPYKILTASELTAAPKIAADSFNEKYSTSHSLGTAPGPGSAIDHALVSKTGLTITKYQSLITAKSIATSDHLPIAIDIKFG